jgi:hypothetical protein
MVAVLDTAAVKAAAVAQTYVPDKIAAVINNIAAQLQAAITAVDTPGIQQIVTDMGTNAATIAASAAPPSLLHQTMHPQFIGTPQPTIGP